MSKNAAPTSWEAYARELGANLFRCRTEAGLTQEDLAHRAGMTRTHYQQIERGSWRAGTPANASVKALVRLAQQLDVPPGRLLPDPTQLEWP